MTSPRLRLSPVAALVLELAADDVETLGWCRPAGDDITLGLIGDGELWEGVHDHLPPEQLTLVGALHRATGADALSWACLAGEEWRPLWDALVLALAAHTGIWERPRTGLHAIESVMRWERTVATHEDVLAVMRRSVAYARDSATALAPTARLGPVQLHPRRWQLSVVRLPTPAATCGACTAPACPDRDRTPCPF